MQYLGGKSRIAGRIAAMVNARRGTGPVWDAFCGGLACARAFGGVVFATDVHPGLIALYRAVAAGWVPPVTVSREDWARAKSLDLLDPLRAFAAFACSFGGIEFGSYRGPYAPHTIGSGPSAGRVVHRNDPAQTASASLCRDVARIIERGGAFDRIDFVAETPAPIDATLYLDPPYRGTAGYSMSFDSDAFDRRAAEWSEFSDVFVSEYHFPIGRCVWEAPETTKGLSQGRAVKRERLFLIERGSL